MTKKPSVSVKDLEAPHLVEKTVSSQLIYQSRIWTVYQDQMLTPQGKPSQREYLKHPGAACIVPVLENGNFLLVRQFRYPLQKVIFEFPAGKKDSGESSLQTAHRELAEETGYKSSRMEFLTSIYPVVGYSDERIDLFAAYDLTPTDRHLDEDENLDVIEVTKENLQTLMWQGHLPDSKTFIAASWILFGP